MKFASNKEAELARLAQRAQEVARDKDLEKKREQEQGRDKGGAGLADGAVFLAPSAQDQMDGDRVIGLDLAAPSISTFPLYYHIQRGAAIADYTDMTNRNRVSAWAKIFRWNHAAEVKAATRGMTRTLLRNQEMSEMGVWIDEGADGGRRFVRTLKSMAGLDWQYVDAIEFTNEQGGYADPARLIQLNAAALGFVAECRAEGKWPVVHNFAVANPRRDLMPLVAESVAAAINAGGYFGTHCYGPKVLMDQAELYVECWRWQVEVLRAAGVNLPNERVLITEFGHDELESYRDPSGQNTSGPWRWLGISLNQVANEYHEYALRLNAAKIGGAFLYNCWGYDSTAARTLRQATSIMDDETHPASVRNYARSVRHAEEGGNFVSDPYELTDLQVNLRGWFVEKTVTWIPPAPVLPRIIAVKPGTIYQSAYLRGAANEQTRVGYALRGTRMRVLAEVGAYYQVAALVDGVTMTSVTMPQTWIPKTLTEVVL